MWDLLYIEHVTLPPSRHRLNHTYISQSPPSLFSCSFDIDSLHGNGYIYARVSSYYLLPLKDYFGQQKKVIQKLA